MNNAPRTNTAAYNGQAYLLAEALQMERELDDLRQALRQARAWGVNSEGFSADQSRKLADWIDSGMTGTPPPIPDYYTK